MLDYINKKQKLEIKDHKCKDGGKKTSDIADSLALVGSQGLDKVDTMEIRTKRLISII